MTEPQPPFLLTAADIASLPEERRVHKVNPGAARFQRTIGKLTGLTALGVHVIRLAPGDTSSEYHFHHHEEEFVYVLAGRGVAEIGDEPRSRARRLHGLSGELPGARTLGRQPRPVSHCILASQLAGPAQRLHFFKKPNVVLISFDF